MIEITQFSPDQLTEYMDAFVAVLKLTVDNGASIGWLYPLDPKEAHTYWTDVHSQIEAGNKVLLVALQDGVIVGTVQLALEPRENGNHRGEVQKLMVHKDYRRQGIARQLMTRIDQAARDANRSLLVLDVRKGDPAETLYRQMGYTHVGDIPAYARSNDGLDATAYYYKQLS